MDINPYDTQHLTWQEWQREPANTRSAAGSNQPHHKTAQISIPQQVTVPRPQQAAHIPKVHAMARAKLLKKCLVVMSLIGFGSFSWLAALHPVHASTSQSTSSASSSTSTTQSTPATSSSSQSTSGNFFNQQGGNNFASNSSGQQPVTGSSVS